MERGLAGDVGQHHRLRKVGGSSEAGGPRVAVFCSGVWGFPGLGFRVQVQGLGFRVEAFGFRIRVSDLGGGGGGRGGMPSSQSPSAAPSS